MEPRTEPLTDPGTEPRTPSLFEEVYRAYAPGAYQRYGLPEYNLRDNQGNLIDPDIAAAGLIRKDLRSRGYQIPDDAPSNAITEQELGQWRAMVNSKQVGPVDAFRLQDAEDYWARSYRSATDSIDPITDADRQRAVESLDSVSPSILERLGNVYGSFMTGIADLVEGGEFIGRKAAPFMPQMEAALIGKKVLESIILDPSQSGEYKQDLQGVLRDLGDRYVLPEDRGTFLDTILGAVGYMIPAVAAGFATGGGSPVASFAGTAAVTVPQTAGRTIETQRQVAEQEGREVTPEEEQRAGTLGAAAGAVYAAPIGRAFGGLGRTAGGVARTAAQPTTTAVARATGAAAPYTYRQQLSRIFASNPRVAQVADDFLVANPAMRRLKNMGATSLENVVAGLVGGEIEAAGAGRDRTNQERITQAALDVTLGALIRGVADQAQSGRIRQIQDSAIDRLDVNGLTELLVRTRNGRVRNKIKQRLEDFSAGRAAPPETGAPPAGPGAPPPGPEAPPRGPEGPMPGPEGPGAPPAGPGAPPPGPGGPTPGRGPTGAPPPTGQGAPPPPGGAGQAPPRGAGAPPPPGPGAPPPPRGAGAPPPPTGQGAPRPSWKPSPQEAAGYKAYRGDFADRVKSIFYSKFQELARKRVNPVDAAGVAWGNVTGYVQRNLKRLPESRQEYVRILEQYHNEILPALQDIAKGATNLAARSGKSPKFIIQEIELTLQAFREFDQKVLSRNPEWDIARDADGAPKQESAPRPEPEFVAPEQPAPSEPVEPGQPGLDIPTAEYTFADEAAAPQPRAPEATPEVTPQVTPQVTPEVTRKATQDLLGTAEKWDWANRQNRSDEWFEGAKTGGGLEGFARARSAGGSRLQAHGMSKDATLSGAINNLINMVRNGLDPNRGGGQLYTAPLVSEGNAGSAVGTASGSAYADGPFMLVAKPGQSLRGNLDGLGAILVNEAHPQVAELVHEAIRDVRPDIIVKPYSEADQVAQQLLATAESAAPQPASEATPTKPVPFETAVPNRPLRSISPQNFARMSEGNRATTSVARLAYFGAKQRPVEQPTVQQPTILGEPVTWGKAEVTVIRDQGVDKVQITQTLRTGKTSTETVTLEKAASLATRRGDKAEAIKSAIGNYLAARVSDAQYYYDLTELAETVKDYGKSADYFDFVARNSTDPAELVEARRKIGEVRDEDLQNLSKGDVYLADITHGRRISVEHWISVGGDPKILDNKDVTRRFFQYTRENTRKLLASRDPEVRRQILQDDANPEKTDIVSQPFDYLDGVAAYGIAEYDAYGDVRELLIDLEDAMSRAVRGDIESVSGRDRLIEDIEARFEEVTGVRMTPTVIKAIELASADERILELKMQRLREADMEAAEMMLNDQAREDMARMELEAEGNYLPTYDELMAREAEMTPVEQPMTAEEVSAHAAIYDAEQAILDQMRSDASDDSPSAAIFPLESVYTGIGKLGAAAGETISSLAKKSGRASGFFRMMKRNLTKTYGLDERLFKKVERRLLAQNGFVRTAQILTRDFQAQLKTYGIDANKLSSQDIKLFNEALGGSATALQAVQGRYPGVDVTLSNMRSEIDRLSRLLLKDAYLEYGNGDLRATITQNDGVYIHTSYRIFNSNDRWYRDVVSTYEQIVEGKQPSKTEIAGLIRNAETGLGKMYGVALGYDDILKLSRGQLNTMAKKYLGNRIAPRRDQPPRWQDDPVYLAVAQRIADIPAHKRAAVVRRDLYTLIEGLQRETGDTGAMIASFGIMNRADNIFKERVKVPPVLQKLYGKVENPMVRFEESISKMSSLLAVDQALNEFVKYGIDKGLLMPKRAADPTRGFIPITESGGEGTWGSLANYVGDPKYVDQVRWFVQNYQAATASLDKFGAAIMRPAYMAETAIKMKHTLFNFAGQVRNFTGSALTSLSNGHALDASSHARAINALVPDLPVIRDAAWRALNKKDATILAKYGIVKDGIQRELADLLRASGIELTGRPDELNAMEAVTAVAGRALKKGILTAQDFYQFGDDLWRASGFFNNAELLAQAYYGRGVNELPPSLQDRIYAEASDRTRDQYPSYGRRSRIVRDLARSPGFTSFISWPTEMVRTEYGKIRLIQKDLNSGNATLVKDAKGRLWYHLLSYAVTAAGVNAVSRFYGTDEDRERAFREDIAAPWERTGLLMFLPSEKGTVTLVNLDYNVPISMFLNLPLSYQYGEGDGPIESFTNALSTLAESAPSLSLQLIGDLTYNNRGDGRRIYEPSDSDEVKWEKIRKELVHRIMPGTNLRNIQEALNDQRAQTVSQYRRDPKIEIANMFLGVRVIKRDIYPSFRAKFTTRTDSYQNKLQSAKSTFISEVFTEVDSLEGMREAYDSYVNNTDNIYNDIRNSVANMETLDVSDERISLLLRDTMGRNDAVVFRGFAVSGGQVPGQNPHPHNMLPIVGGRDPSSFVSFMKTAFRNESIEDYLSRLEGDDVSAQEARQRREYVVRNLRWLQEVIIERSRTGQ